jgi:hypothetical protein
MSRLGTEDVDAEKGKIAEEREADVQRGQAAGRTATESEDVPAGDEAEDAANDPQQKAA